MASNRDLGIKIYSHHTQEQYMDDESDRGSVISAIRKTKSIDASCLDMRSLGDVVNSSKMNMPRAKSEFNLTTTATIERKFDLNPKCHSCCKKQFINFSFTSIHSINQKQQQQQHRKMMHVW